jgi:hypothetical protein
MIHAITRAALRLDLWLQAKLGRPYNALLGVGLTIEIIRRLIEIPERLASAHRLAVLALTVAMELALLIHQVGALSHHITPRGPGRRRGRLASAETPAPTVADEGEAAEGTDGAAPGALG